MAIKKPTFGSIAKTEKTGRNIAGYSDSLVARDDSVLKAKGGDLKIYEDVLRDDQVKATFQQRRMAVVSKDWHVEPGGTKAIDKRAAIGLEAQLHALDWDTITDRMLYGIYYGYAIAEAIYEKRGNTIALADVAVRDRSRFRFGDSGRVYLVGANGQLTQMPERKFWTVATGSDHDDQPYGRGLAHYLYWPAFFKRNGVKFWITFLDKFASPTAMGKMDVGAWQDERMRKDVLEALQAIHSDSAIVVPEGVEAHLMEATRSGSADYETMVRRMDAAISKVVLSQTMTTDDGSSRSQAEVHKGVRDEVVEADAQLINASFCQSIGAWLTEWNFPGAAVPEIIRDTDPGEDLNQRAERDQKVHALGYDPTPEYIDETYGEGWVKREPNQQRVPMDDPQFAELVGLTADKNRNRENQQAIVQAAEQFASDYQGIMGQRVRELLEYAEHSKDLQTFREQLNEMIEAPPGDAAVESLQRSGLVSRLMGWMRGQR